MRHSKLSFALILLALAFGLSAASPHANGTLNLDPKSKPASPPTKQQASEPHASGIRQESEPKKESDKAQQSPATPPESPVVIDQPASESEKARTTSQPQQPFYERLAVAFAPNTWATWAQVIIGTFGLIVIFLTLKAIQSQVKANHFTAKAAWDSVGLARKEFLATHRPRFMVRRLEFLEEGGVPIGIQYTIHNAGESVGTLTAVSERLWLAETGYSLHLIPAYRGPTTEAVTLQSGEHTVRKYIHPDEEDLAFYPVTFMNPQIQGNKPMFLGYIDYRDQAGLARRTAFLREYDPATRRFIPVQHPDYEYQD